MLKKAAKKSLDAPPTQYNVKKCRMYSEEIYVDYIEGLLVEEEKNRFESHLDLCPYCLIRVKESILIDDRVEKSYVLSELGQKRSLSKTLRHLDNLHQTSKSKKRAFLLAASKEKTGKTGVAYGVAVDQENNCGALLECLAWVSVDETEQGILDIRGIEVESVRKDDIQVTVSSPLELLEDQMEDLFKSNPYLKPFKLDKRGITVDVSQGEGNGYISEAQSLSLSIIVAILNAVTGREGKRDMAFSARVRQDGKLQRVGNVKLKLKVARENGINEFLMSDENRKDFDEALMKKSGISVLSFPRLESALDFLGFFKFVDEYPKKDKEHIDLSVEKNLDYPRINRTVEGWKFIVDMAREKDIGENLAIELCELTEDLCQIRQELKPMSTALVIGNPEKIANILPASPLKLTHNGDILSMRRAISALSSVVNGLTMGFLIETNGRVHSIRKVNIELGGDFPVSRLLEGINRRYAILSRMTEAMIFFIALAGNRVKVFCNGAMVGRYINGDWEPTDLDAFESVLMKAAEKKDILQEIVEKIGRTAIKMSDQNEGGIFVFFSDRNDIKQKYSDALKRLSVRVDIDSIRDLSDDELINFAKEDGAVLVDHKGNLHTFMAFLNPRQQDMTDYEMGIGTRHYNARALSKDIGCLCIVISQDGIITVYCDGERLYQI